MKQQRPNLRLTGPTPLPPKVLQALDQQVISHRSPEFRHILLQVIEYLRSLLDTTSEILPFTTSGTGGLEAAVVNTLAPGAKVLTVQTGYFGERFAEIADRFGATVIPWIIPQGQAVDPRELRQQLRSVFPLAAVLLTHNETSTGILNPLQELATVVRNESDALILVDGVSSVGAVELAMDNWGLDVVVTVSQKALMSPPGLAIVAVSPRALAAAKQNAIKRYYFDFVYMSAMVADGMTSYTPAVSTIFGLKVALDLIFSEGLSAVYARHRELAEQCRVGMTALGFTCFADLAYASPTITAVLVPPGHSAGEIRRRLEEEHLVIVSQGRNTLRDYLLRVGHMGYVEPCDILHLLKSIGALNLS